MVPTASTALPDPKAHRGYRVNTGRRAIPAVRATRPAPWLSRYNVSLVVVAAARDFAVMVGDSGTWNEHKQLRGTRSKICAGPGETLFGLIGYPADSRDWTKEFREVTSVFKFPRMSSEVGA